MPAFCPDMCVQTYNHLIIWAIAVETAHEGNLATNFSTFQDRTEPLKNTRDCEESVEQLTHEEPADLTPWSGVPADLTPYGVSWS